MRSYSAILFDLDGTLRDTKNEVIAAYIHAVETHTGHVPSIEDLRPYMHHHSAVHKALSAHAPYDKWLQTYRVKLDETWNDLPFFEGAEKTLEACKMAGYRLAVVTSADYERTIEYLSYRNIDRYFEVVVAMREKFRPKPAPDLMEEAIRQLGVDAAQTITVGDMVTDVQAAHAAGIACIGITHGFASREELESAGADYIVDSLPEVLEIVELAQEK